MQADSAQQQGLYRPEFDHDACGIGALADINGERHHQILDDALSILVNLEHRGGTGLEKNTGDGAGILFQVPHHFFRKEAQKCGQILPAEGDYGVAMLFFPQDDKGVEDARRVFEEGCAEAGVPLLFWREVPVDPHDLGETARACMPTILQAFLGRPDDTPAGDAFERRLYVCRRTIEKKADAEFALRDKIFYVCSMSSRTIVYKGMLVATQMRRFFIDLNDAAVKTAVALVHSRYSTNTTPSWERAHPNRFIIHNGEINTLKGNVNWIRAREPNLYSPVLQHDLERVMPIINREGSDSAILDNVLEFLVMNGRPLTRAASMLLPEPWDHNDSLSEERRAYDAYQSMLMEPWDGPAAIAFTDGRTLGAALDRNGLRPARYYVTRDGRFMLASEVGTIEVSPENILTSGCLGPGQMLEVDFARGRVIYNDELRARYAKEKPYRDWIAEETLTVDALDKPVEARIADYHVGGTGDHATVMPAGMPAFTKDTVYDGMMRNFAQTFGDAIVDRPTGATDEVAFGTTQRWAGIPFRFDRGAATDFPAASILIGGKVCYTHWAPAKAHANSLQISSPAAVDAEIAEARRALASGAELFIGGHGGAAGADAVRFKIDYLECVKRLLAANGTADEFARALRAAYPELPGEAGLDALAQALYADR